ncbi:hypothetical protein D3C80_2114110 [compost metagenome]
MAKVAWNGFYSLAQVELMTVKGVPLTLWNFGIFLVVSEIVIWFIHSIFGNKGSGGESD